MGVSRAIWQVALANRIRDLQRVRQRLGSQPIDECPAVIEDVPKTQLKILKQSFVQTAKEEAEPTNVHMEKYIQRRMAELQGSQPLEDEPREKLDEIERKKRKTTGSFANANFSMGIQEYDLPLEDRLRNIEATEAAKQAAMRKAALLAAKRVEKSTGLIPCNIGSNFHLHDESKGWRGAFGTHI